MRKGDETGSGEMVLLPTPHTQSVYYLYPRFSLFQLTTHELEAQYPG